MQSTISFKALLFNKQQLFENKIICVKISLAMKVGISHEKKFIKYSQG